jgi:ABC-type sugar transport system permease subunit
VAALAAWHALLVPLAVAGVVAAVGLSAVPAAVRFVAVVLAAVAAVANAAAVPLLLRLDHRGRGIALVVDYLVLVAALGLLLQVTGVLRGIDALGGTFGRGMPFLGVVLAGFLVGALGDREQPRRPAARAGRALLLAGAAGWLLAVGLLPGLLTFARRLAAPVPLLLLAAAVVAAACLRVLWGIGGARAFGATRRQAETLNGFLLLSPNLLGFLLFFAGPLAFSLYVSLYEWDAFGTREFLGLGNYAEILGDPLFWRSLRNILVVAVVGIPLSVVPALGLATLLNARAPGVRIFRALFFLPAVAGVVGVALIWKQLFDGTVGFINYGIRRSFEVAGSLPGVDATAPQPGWLSDESVALAAVIIVFAWQMVGLNTVYFLAGLQAIPGDLYEAAHLDGASRWQRFRNITVPLLGPTTFFVVVSTGILSLQLFAEPFILFSRTQPPGAGPGFSTLTPVVYLYNQGFQRFAQGYASAVAWVLFALIFLFTFAQFQRQRAQASTFGGE